MEPDELAAVFAHMGTCKKHNIVYVEIDPTKPEGCPKCSPRPRGVSGTVVAVDEESNLDEQA